MSPIIYAPEPHRDHWCPKPRAYYEQPRTIWQCDECGVYWRVDWYIEDSGPKQKEWWKVRWYHFRLRAKIREYKLSQSAQRKQSNHE